MSAKLRAALTVVKEKLSLNQHLLARAQHRYKANRKRAFIAHNRQEKARRLADQRRREGHPKLAASFDEEARRHAHVAYRNHLRAQFWLGRIKVLQQRIHGLKTRAEHYEAEIKKNRAKVDGNKVTGGSRRQRLRLALHTAARNCASGDQNNYYDMEGALPDLGHTLEGMPYGHRFDCSSFATGIDYCCGLPDPNGGDYTPGETMYTGSLGEHGRRVSKAHAKTGDAVLYGPAPHHHIEKVDDPDEESTIGHGSAPIDAGKFDLFGGGTCASPGGPGPQSLADYEIRTYL
jgi:hypothetical protein